MRPTIPIIVATCLRTLLVAVVWFLLVARLGLFEKPSNSMWVIAFGLLIAGIVSLSRAIFAPGLSRDAITRMSSIAVTCLVLGGFGMRYASAESESWEAAVERAKVAREKREDAAWERQTDADLALISEAYEKDRALRRRLGMRIQPYSEFFTLCYLAGGGPNDGTLHDQISYAVKGLELDAQIPVMQPDEIAKISKAYGL